jgi:hypothetical protein
MGVHACMHAGSLDRIACVHEYACVCVCMCMLGSPWLVHTHSYFTWMVSESESVCLQLHDVKGTPKPKLTEPP